MKITYVSKTDVGLKRKTNEDALLVNLDIGLFVVADGMGGHACGEVASREAVETLQDNLLSKISTIHNLRKNPNNQTTEEMRKLLELSVRAAAYQVYGLSEVDPDRKGMGTTLSVLMIQPAAGFIAHVGDSRIYAIRGGQSRIITNDHTFVATMVQQGKMTAEQAKQSPYSNMLVRAVGSHDYVEVDTRVIRYLAGDTFLLCSDGLYNYLRDGELVNLVDTLDLRGSIIRLIQTALKRGGKDNITGVLVRVDA